MMKFMINSIGKNIIFTDCDEDVKSVTFGFFGPYLMVYPNKTPEKITEIEVVLEENKTAKMDKLIEEIFVMRNMENKLFECVGPYNEDGVVSYAVNVKSTPINPVREGAILERIDWERNKERYEKEDAENYIKENEE